MSVSGDSAIYRNNGIGNGYPHVTCPVGEPGAAFRSSNWQTFVQSEPVQFVPLFNQALMQAMPMAPPRLRIVLKRALAIFRRSGGTEPNAILVAGTMHKRMEKPRRNCGQKSSVRSILK